jgi:hypothetical protein
MPCCGWSWSMERLEHRQYPIQGLQQALGGNPIRPHPGNRSFLKTSLTFSLEVARIDIIICVLLEIGQIQFN